ncbi:glycosyltransferase [candidate division KSB3 bacterium]|uniref:Glycosyltransferase n=1 Tax=candidate division KSB3 bacterium TaxID=2044937 RepID=A0A9D5Q5G0_9BACT|nr:glycosyltransferase [candidate division KSB3 bacterium]MBD3324298.1 glycosyltransferase [candidate division KSB3 bacterium]
MKRILVISGDLLPYPGFPTTGAGLRAWGIGKGLETKGHEVVLAMPRSSAQKLGPPPQELLPVLYTYQELETFIIQHDPDIIIFGHWILANFLPERLEIPLVIDFHGPLLLETQFQANPAVDKLKREKILALRNADFFTCAGEKQRYYFQAWLMMAGFDLRQDLIASIPVSLSPDLPKHQSQGEPVFVYGGIFLPWQDPVLGLHTLIECLEHKQKGLLKFFGGKHPVLAVPTGKFEELRDYLQRSPRVQMQPLIPRDQLIQEYCQAHVAIDLMQRNAERELAFTTRTVEYLWCGLPVIYNNYAELSSYISDYNAGWTLDPGDTLALRRVIEEIIEQPAAVAERSHNAQRLVRERLTWDRTIDPLDAFCRNPVKPQKAPPYLA